MPTPSEADGVADIVVPISAGTARSLTDLADRAHHTGADLVELRLDLCAEAGLDPESALRELKSWRLPAVVTCRSAAEGGSWRGEEAARLALLTLADRMGAAFIDCELAAVDGLGERAGRAKLVLSHHDFSGMGAEDLGAVVERAYAAGADIAKVAVTPHDAADLDTLAGLCARWGAHGDEAETERGLVALGMGEVGLPSRLLAGAWGSAWTFGRLDGRDAGTAAGQPPVRDLIKRYRVRDQGPDTRIFGVLGDPVGHSLSPVLHNAAFQADDLDAVYVPFLAHDAVAFWRACQSWIDGLSITIPHKTALIEELDEVEELALQVGAVNTIYRGDDGEAMGANTDAPAAVDCVEQACGNIEGRRVLVLGAGGVARAIAFAMHSSGAQVTIANRTQAKAEQLAHDVGCFGIALADAYDQTYDVLINATSVGMESEETPWPEDRHHGDTVAFDTIYTPLETVFLRDAQDAGAIPVCGLSMLICQAAGQYERWTGLEAPLPLMQRVGLESLHTQWSGHFARKDSMLLNPRG